MAHTPILLIDRNDFEKARPTLDSDLQNGDSVLKREVARYLLDCFSTKTPFTEFKDEKIFICHPIMTAVNREVRRRLHTLNVYFAEYPQDL